MVFDENVVNKVSTTIFPLYNINLIKQTENHDIYHVAVFITTTHACKHFFVSFFNSGSTYRFLHIDTKGEWIVAYYAKPGQYCHVCCKYTHLYTSYPILSAK